MMNNIPTRKYQILYNLPDYYSIRPLIYSFTYLYIITFVVYNVIFGISYLSCYIGDIKYKLI